MLCWPGMDICSDSIDCLPGKERRRGALERPLESLSFISILHHGLLMNSEIWVCVMDPVRSLPFVLVENGYDVWLGDNRYVRPLPHWWITLICCRGNKYSRKCLHYGPNMTKFWDFRCIQLFPFAHTPFFQYRRFCMARYSRFNTPYFGSNKESKAQLCGIQSGNCTGFRSPQHSSWTQWEGEHLHRISTCNESSWSCCAYCWWAYEGFVSFQLFRHKNLVRKIPRPTLLFLFFGRNSILSSATMWQAIMYPPIFTKLIDKSLFWLFNWRSDNITSNQKIAAYAHLCQVRPSCIGFRSWGTLCPRCMMTTSSLPSHERQWVLPDLRGSQP